MREYTVNLIEGYQSFVMRSSNAANWLRRTKNILCIPACVLGLPYKETFPPDPEIFSLAEK